MRLINTNICLPVYFKASKNTAGEASPATSRTAIWLTIKQLFVVWFLFGFLFVCFLNRSPNTLNFSFLGGIINCMYHFSLIMLNILAEIHLPVLFLHSQGSHSPCPASTPMEEEKRKATTDVQGKKMKN